MMNFLSIRADCCWDSFCAYVGPFRGYVGAKKFVLKLKIFWCEKVGLASHMFGLCWAMWRLCWAMFGLSWAIWGLVGAMLRHVGPAVGDLGL